MHINNTGYVTKVTPIEVCGKTVMIQLNVDGIYTAPFEVSATPGPHDFRECPPCAESLMNITNKLTQRFIGNDKKKGFPFCCEGHSNLIKRNEYKFEDFENAPNLVANKIIYTVQHFINVSENINWYKMSIDYLEWVIMSFGNMPKDCGEPLFLTSYFFHLEDLLKRNRNLPIAKRTKILNAVKDLKKNEVIQQTDINILAKTYEKWINTFPFELTSYFGSMKDVFINKFLIWDGEPDVNIYSGLAKLKIHTKESLINSLIELTDKLLTEINGVALFEKGLITDSKKIRLELLINERKEQLQSGYLNKSSDEDARYRKIIKNWYKDERAFFEQLAPLLGTYKQTSIKNKPLNVSSPIISLFCFLVNESLADIKKENETILKYCKRVCQKHGLKFTDRVRQGYSNSRNNKNIQMVKNLILPKIDKETKDKIVSYLDSKQPPTQSMYG